MSEMPTLILVHGGWSGAWIWDSIKPELADLGVSSSAVELRGSKVDHSFLWGITLTDYVNEITATAAEIDGPVVLVAHSAGGIAASQAAAETPGHFSSLIYLTAYAPVDGESLASLSAQDKESNTKSAIKPDLIRGALRQSPESIKASSYHDCSSEIADQLVRKHRPEPIRPSMAKVRLGEDFDRLPKVYIQCAQDRALTPAFQQWMAERQKIETIHQLGTGHMPMVDAPGKLAAMLMNIVQ